MDESRRPEPVIRVRRVEGAPVVAVRVWLPGGSRAERLPGQALVAGRLMAEGTRRRDWRRISEESESRGCSIVTTAGRSVQAVAIDGLAGDWTRILDWAAELMVEASFPQDRCDWLRQQTKAELESLADLPEVVTRWAFMEQLYPGHPLGRPLQGTVAGLDALDRDACLSFHEACLGAGPLIAVTGQIDPSVVLEHVKNLIGETAASRSAPVELADPKAPVEATRRVSLPPGDQAHLCIGGLTVRRADRDFEAVRLLGVILGSGSGVIGRIPKRIREEEGLAYGCDVETVAGAGVDPGRLVVSLSTARASLARAVTIVREELERIRQHGVADSEIEAARSYLLGREPFGRETARQWALLELEAMLWHVPVNDPEWVREQLLAVRAEDVRRVAGICLQPASLVETLGVPK